MISVYDLFNYKVQYMPDKVALIYNGMEYTYGELSERVCRLACGMRKIGVEQGSHVGYLVHNSPVCIEIFYACQKIGAVAIPFNFRLPSEDIAKLIDLVDCDYFAFGQAHREIMNEATVKCSRQPVYIYADEDAKDNEIAYESLFQYGIDDAQTGAAASKATALMLFTGGTTGLPKAAMLSGEALYLKSVMHLTDTNDFSSESVMMCYSPLFHIAGMTYLLYLFAQGGTLYLAGTFNADDTLQTIERFRITHMFLIPPNMCSLLKKSPLYGKCDVSSVKLVIMSGARNYPDLVKEVFDMFPNTKVSNTYGHTESVADTILCLTREEFEEKPHLVETVGKMTKGSFIELRDDSGAPVPTGTPGRVWAKNCAAMTGFYKIPSPFVNGWYDTGDIMKQDEEGYFYFIDRAKDMVKTGGENVFCIEVEAVLRSHPAVSDCAVFGIPDEKWSEAVVAAVVLMPDAQAGEDELISWCRDHMASYKKPQKIFYVEQLPRTTLGKVNKVALRKRYGA